MAKPVFLSDCDLSRLKNQLKKIMDSVDRVSANTKEIEEDLVKIAKSLPSPPKLIRGEKDLLSVQRTLMKMQALRTRLVQHQRACERAKTNLAQLIDLAQGWIKIDPQVASLRNEGLRNMVFQQVAPKLIKRNARVLGCLKEIEHLLWGLKDNQMAAMIQMQSWKEETWAHKQGLD